MKMYISFSDLFLWIASEEGRARSAENVSIHTSFSYGLYKKKAAQRETQRETGKHRE